MSSDSTNENGFDALLQQLRDHPADNKAANEELLQRIFKHLMAVKPTPSGQLHWFCDQASSTTVGAASFLIRLFGFNGPSVEAWKTGVRQCVSMCAFCVESLEVIKVSSRSTYFGAYQDSVLQNFFGTFEDWELKVVLEDLEKAGFAAGGSNTSGRTLADIPSQLLYRTMANWRIFSDASIQALLHAHVPARSVPGWPRYPPPGMLILFMDASQDIRDWARKQCFSSDLSLMPASKFTTSYFKAFETMAAVIQGSTNSEIPTTLTLSSDPAVLWTAFSSALRLVPIERLSASHVQSLDLRRVITGHLHDNGPHFIHVLRSLLLLLKRLSNNLWTGEASDFPQVVFDSVKDNQTFLSLLQENSLSGDTAWILTWIPELLHTIQGTSKYGELLAKTVDFLCEELQHERFRDSRPAIMNTGIQLLAAAFRKSDRDPDFRHRDALQNTLDIHGAIVVAVAYDRPYSTEIWKDVRTSARALVAQILSSDARRIEGTISSTCKSLLQVKLQKEAEPIPALSIRLSVWKSVYANIQPKDIPAISSIIPVVAKFSYLSTLLKEPYEEIELVKAQGPRTVDGSKVIDQINDALKNFQSGFLDVISRFADYNMPSSAVEMISQPEVGKAVVALLLSPVPDFQMAAQTIIGLAYDADVRVDCFRAVLSSDTKANAAFEGLIDFLHKFSRYAAQVPEACAVSTSLVRCFNDVLEVLCSSSRGKLFDNAFLRLGDPSGPGSRLLELWKLLTTSLTVIFKRTIAWAPYYKPNEMVEWMRDAIILGRDMIKQWRTIEIAANGNISKPSKQLSEAGEKIIGSFQDMLYELSKWLRLTDEELLYQSLTILRSLLEVFKQTKKRPREQTIEKLLKYISQATNDKTKSKSRLDANSLMQLEETLAPFVETAEESEDEIEIISHTKSSDKKAIKPAISLSAPSKPPKDKKPPTHLQQQLLLNKQLGGNKHSKSLLDVRQRMIVNKTWKDDEAKIQAASKLPSFRRTAQPVASTSKVGSVPQQASDRTVTTSTKTSSPPESSESDSSSDDDNNPEVGLGALVGKQRKSPKVKKPPVRQEVKRLDIPFAKNPIQERLQRARLEQNRTHRLHPDISNLHKVILSWNYGHDGPLPPVSGRINLATVPGEFSNYNEYCRIFEPLLFLECWAQIQRAKEEKPASHLCKIDSKRYVDDWIEMDIGFEAQLPNDWDLSETDIVLLSTPDRAKSIIAKALSCKKGAMGATATVRCSVNVADPGLQVGSPWNVSKLFNLRTVNREYGALKAIPYINFFDHILHPKAAKIPNLDPQEVQTAMSLYQINKPQATAVLGAMSSEGFVLIQGPPGTGKTSTISALVSRFMTQRALPIRVPGKDGKDGKEEPPKAKVLICAPSNAAIDEIAQRLVSKFSQSDKKLNIVRIGSEYSIGPAVQSISLDALARKKLEAETGQKGADEDSLRAQMKALDLEMISLKSSREEKLKELENLSDNFARRSILEREAQALREKRQALAQRLTGLKDQLQNEKRNQDSRRRIKRHEVIVEADIICSTLSGAGQEALTNEQFEMVIIDEAAQAIELSTIIPLKYNCTRCVLVGDPQQLPPTVISQEATRRGYDQSLFVRLFNKCRGAVHLLSIQYRMHPEISRFPSNAFYQGRIEDGPHMKELTTRPWHSDPIFGTYKFFNVNGNEEPGASSSLRNKAEVQAAKDLYSRLKRQFQKEGLQGRIGIVSMYSAQVTELRVQFHQAFGSSIVDDIAFHTVDGFQGQEKDIIILSCVRAGPGVDRIGFLADIRRLNVAITRAKSSLFIVGNVATLERSDETWKKVVADARERSLIVNVDSKTFTQPNIVRSVEAVELPKKKPKVSQAGPYIPPPPVDLATPKELKELMKKPTNPPPADTTSSSVVDLTAVPSRPHLKRPAEDEISSSSTSTAKPRQPQTADGSAPRPPPKKAKQMAMFIPKKPKK